MSAENTAKVIGDLTYFNFEMQKGMRFRFMGEIFVIQDFDDEMFVATKANDSSDMIQGEYRVKI